VAVTLFGIYYHELEKRMEGAKEFIIAAVIGFIVTMLFEAVLLVLLFRAIKERSFKKCQIWLVLNGIVFTISFVSFMFEIFSGYPKSLVVTLGELLFDGFALKIVYDFLKEIKTTPTGDVPFEVMKNETV